MSPRIVDENKNVNVSTKQVVEEKHLKGTFISVLFVGGFIVLSWVGIYWLYMSRL